MFDALCAKVTRDPDLPERAWKLDCLRRVLNGTLYDVLQHPFHQERQGRNGDGEYIPVFDRRPSVRYNLCGMVAKDTTRILFGEGRFPTVECEDQAVTDTLAGVIKESKLNRVMSEAALRGSIGSVVVLLRVLSQRLFFEVMDTVYLTPEWQPLAPDTLLNVTELRKVPGSELAALGYSIPDDEMTSQWWFSRVWDSADETWLVPIKVDGKKRPTARDNTRSVRHNLGFVPMVWMRNLPGGDAVDGACTFKQAIPTSIEIDYQLSQAGRGLRYSSDPTLLLKEPAQSDGTLVRSASNAIIVSADGDGKMLEISGTAADAVIEYARCCRELALESIHGNRSSADKLSAAQSGKALELLHQPLIGVADDLRTSFGEDGFLSLARMIVRARQRFPFKVAGKLVPELPADPDLTLNWPPYFPLTLKDMVDLATAIGLAKDNGFMSTEAAVRQWAPANDIEDVEKEMAAIKGDQDDAQQREIATAQATKPLQPKPATP